MTAVDLTLDPGAWRPRLRPRKRWTRTVLYRTRIRTGATSPSQYMARYMAIREILGMSCGRREKVSRDIMDRAEWADVDVDGLSAESCDLADVAGGGIDGEERADLVRFVGALEVLDERHRYVLVQRTHGATLDEIGEVLDLSRERVRQIGLVAVRKIRDELKLDPPARKPPTSVDVWRAQGRAEAVAWCARWNAGG